MNDNDSPLGKPHFAGCVCMMCEQQKAEAMTERTIEQQDPISQISDALKLAQIWLGNSMPVVELEGPKPMPVIAAALERIEDLEPLRRDAEMWRKVAASVVSGLKHIGPFKRIHGDDPHPLDCTLAGRVSHVFGVGMTSAISLCKEFGQDPEWRE